MLNLLEQINKEDIDKVISYSQNIKNPVTDKLLTKWANAKEQLSKNFLNGKTHYTFPDKVTFQLSYNSQHEQFDYLFDYIVNVLNDTSWEHPLTKFLRKLKIEDFYNNYTSKEYIINEEENKKIPIGAKVIKSFKYFLDNDQLLHDLQDKASSVIQKNKVEGYLTFSIHPLDFLSSSENTYNWRSCHSLDGEYRAGNLSYIGDSSTMIVYLSSEKQEKLPHFPDDVPWNSKKWRMLMHFDENCEVCFAGRQYPFSSPGALDIIHSIFVIDMVPLQNNWKGFTTKEKWSPWYNDYLETFTYKTETTVPIEEDRYCVINHGIYDIYKMIEDAPYSRHFNDLINSSYYTRPFYMFKEYWSPIKEIKINVGSSVECLKCGNELIEENDTMLCVNCDYEDDDELYHTCDCCGAKIHKDYGYWVDNDKDFVCQQCFNTQTFDCVCCAKTFYINRQRWDDNLEGFVCEHCFNERNEKSNG